MQYFSQSKIRELEEKLQEERHQRKLLQDRAAEVCKGFAGTRHIEIIMLELYLML